MADVENAGTAIPTTKNSAKKRIRFVVKPIAVAKTPKRIEEPIIMPMRSIFFAKTAIKAPPISIPKPNESSNTVSIQTSPPNVLAIISGERFEGATIKRKIIAKIAITQRTSSLLKI